MIDLTIMAKTNENETPGCAGCGYLIEHDWTCDYIGNWSFQGCDWCNQWPRRQMCDVSQKSEG